MSQSIWSFAVLLALAGSPGLAVAQGSAASSEAVAEEVIAENVADAGSPELAVVAEPQQAPAAEAEKDPSVDQPPPAEENPFADMIGMTQKELRKKWGRPSPNSPGTNGDGIYFYDLAPDLMVVVVIQDKKVFKIRGYQKTD